MITIIKSKKFPKKYCATLHNKKVCFGDIRYQHFKDKIGHYSYLNHYDKKRRLLFHQRHNCKNAKKYTPNWFSCKYLW